MNNPIDSEPQSNPTELERPPHERLRQMATGFILSKALMLMSELGIADLLKNNPSTADELARKTNTEPISLYRLMRFLASHDIFSEDSSHKFSLTPMSSLMISDEPNSMHNYLLMLADDPPWDSVKNMLYTIQTGKPAFEHIHKQNFFDYMSKHPTLNAIFNKGLTAFTSPDDFNLVNAYDFSDHNCVVDIGGGKGTFLASILSQYKHLQGILFDQREITLNLSDQISEFIPKSCNVLSGNFFESVPSCGDIYIMKLILHDWNDEQAISILHNCNRALPPNGKLLVIEGLILDGNQYDPHKQLDISMMLIFGGRERTKKEFSYIFQQAGLKLSRIIPTTTRLSIIEVEKL